MLRVEGIVLSRLQYQDYDQILTIFTLQEGLVKLICKQASRSKKGMNASTSPLTRAEFVYRLGKGEISRCDEVSVIQQYVALRQRLDYLESACDMLKALSQSQMLGKPAPALYALLSYYLEHLPLMQVPEVLALSFRLKILRHEGILDLEEEGAKVFSPEDLRWMHHFAYCQNFAELREIGLPVEGRLKCHHLFEMAYR